VRPVVQPHTLHLSKSGDLVTAYEQTRAGFIALALERNLRATPYVDQARALKYAASRAQNPSDLLNISNIQGALLTAAGISDKAEKHLTESDRVTAIQELVDKFLLPAGDQFVEELVFRYLLTKGDTLGGSMRNIGGIFAQYKLVRAVIAILRLANIECMWLNRNGKKWFSLPNDYDPHIIKHVKGLHWNVKGKNRILLCNFKVPIVGNVIDLILLNADAASNYTHAIKSPKCYIALGELKGGIDPAGADEHWKTASKALERIRNAFISKNLRPATFFIGAAIEKKMSEEIWDELSNGILSNAANLNNSDQISSICNWLINL